MFNGIWFVTLHAFTVVDNFIAFTFFADDEPLDYSAGLPDEIFVLVSAILVYW